MTRDRSIDDMLLALDPDVIGVDAFLFAEEAGALADGLRLGGVSNGVAGNGLPGWAKDWDIGYVGDWGEAKGGNGKGGGGGGGGDGAGGGKPDKPGKPPKDEPPAEDPPPEEPPTDPPAEDPPILTEVVSSYTSGHDPAFYNIEIVFNGSLWTVPLQQAFVDAAELLSDIIVGDVPDITLFGTPIDDIQIEAELSNIDGTGGVLGQAGPEYYRTAEKLPINGIMEFDVADAEWLHGDGLFDDVVFHEMMHVLGFGTMWEIMGLLDTYGSGPSLDYRFNGAAATAMYQSEFAAEAATDPRATDGVPVETDGGPGTAGGHWDDATFGGEIMTGYIDGANFLSDMTVAALDDMGYQLSSNAYDVGYLV